MDTWNAYDTTVSEPLRITTLPNTVEQFMAEESGITTPIMRRMGHTRKGIDKDNREKTLHNVLTPFVHSVDNMVTQAHNVTSWLNG
jgi:hypothetical protein